MRRLLDDLPDGLRAQALTHPAFAEARGDSFERLEFLGDSVLDLVITEAIFRRFPDLDEGALSKVRAAAVSRETCAIVAADAGLGDRMVEHAALAGRAQEATARRLATQRNALAALTESVIGAAFLHVGYDGVSAAVLNSFEERLAHALTHREDSKSQLQELASHLGGAVRYSEIGEDGPPHDRRFTIAASVEWATGERAQQAARETGTDPAAMCAEGSGRSKQEAQQAAASRVLEQLGREQG